MFSGLFLEWVLGAFTCFALPSIFCAYIFNGGILFLKKERIRWTLEFLYLEFYNVEPAVFDIVMKSRRLV